MTQQKAVALPRELTPRAGILYRYRGLRAVLLLAPSLTFLLVLFVLPLAKIVVWSFLDAGSGAYTLEHYLYAFTRPIYFQVILNTFRISLIITVLALLLGYPVAYLLSRLPPGPTNLLMILVLLPFWTSLLVRTYAWTVILQRRGPINELLLGLGLIDSPLQLVHNTIGVVVGMTHILLPFMILPLYSVMRGIDPNLLRAAQNLGAGPWRTFRRVFFPLSLPGVGAGCLLVFVLSIGYFITPALLGGLGDTFIAQLIEQQVNVVLNWNFAAALAVTLFVATMILLYLYNRLLGLDKIWGGP